MKISVQLKKSQLDEIIIALQDERPEIQNRTMVDKTYFYLFHEAFKKLLRKQIDKADDYTNKAFKINFTYPQACALFNELLKVRSSNAYRWNCRTILITELSQKLS